MERDRTLLALSSAGLGLLATLLTTIGIGSRWQFTLYVLASSSFLASVFGGLAVFHLNSGHLEDLIYERPPRRRLLNFSTGVLGGGFVLGIILTLLLAFWLGKAKVDKETLEMSKRENTALTPSDWSQKGLDGFGGLFSGNGTPGHVGGGSSPSGGANSGGGSSPSGSGTGGSASGAGAK
jgi:hypothetical protein